MSKVLQESVRMAKISIKIIYIKETQAESIPADGIDFNELISTQGEFDRNLKIQSFFLVLTDILRKNLIIRKHFAKYQYICKVHSTFHFHQNNFFRRH